MNVSRLVEYINSRFSEAKQYHHLLQEIAEVCYYERATFTKDMSPGSDMVSGVADSEAAYARRDLGHAIGTMLRPTARKWFHLRVYGDEKDQQAKQWLEEVSDMMRNVMNDSESGFSRAVADCDHDYAAFGAGCISVEFDREDNLLVFRNWHLRDMAWDEDEKGRVASTFRRWDTQAAIAVDYLGRKNCHQKMVDKAAKNPHEKVKIYHGIIPASRWVGVLGGKKYRAPRVSVYIDVDNEHICLQEGTRSRYVIPRWSLALGGQYAVSPAAITALADIRTMDQVVTDLLNATEKMLDPPLITQKDAIRGPIQGYAGGVTPVDSSYDARTGSIVERLYGDTPFNIPVGIELLQYYAEKIRRGFMLNKLAIPSATESKEMTAFEVGQRVQEFIRNALPVFGPMEDEYNGQLCHAVLDLLLLHAPELVSSMPKQLSGRDIRFSFESPLHDAVDRMKQGQYMEALQVLAQAVQFDQSVLAMWDAKKATRAVLNVVAPAEWVLSVADQDRKIREQEQMIQAQQALQGMQQAADVAKTLQEASPR